MPEKDLLISHPEKVSLGLLFLAGCVVSFLKVVNAGKVQNLWQVGAYSLLGGFLTCGVGAALLWVFPDMPFFIVLMIAGSVSTLFEREDIRNFILVKLNAKTKQDTENKQG